MQILPDMSTSKPRHSSMLSSKTIQPGSTQHRYGTAASVSKKNTNKALTPPPPPPQKCCNVIVCVEKFVEVADQLFYPTAANALPTTYWGLCVCVGYRRSGGGGAWSDVKTLQTTTNRFNSTTKRQPKPFRLLSTPYLVVPSLS